MLSKPSLVLHYWAERNDDVARSLPLQAFGEDLKSFTTVAPQPDVETPNPNFQLIEVKLPLDSELALSIGTQNTQAPLHYSNDDGFVKRLINNQPSQSVRLLIGSCNFPGYPFDRTYANTIFKHMQSYTNGEFAAQALFMLGDQIYADQIWKKVPYFKEKKC